MDIVQNYKAKSGKNLLMLLQESCKPDVKAKNQTTNESAINQLSSLVDKLSSNGFRT